MRKRDGFVSIVFRESINPRARHELIRISQDRRLDPAGKEMISACLERQSKAAVPTQVRYRPRATRAGT